MKKMIRRFLGLPEDGIAGTLAAHEEVLRIHANQMRNATTSIYKKLDEELAITNLAVGRVIAKIDPTYIRSEHDPKRLAESEELGNKVIERIRAEHTAASRMNFPGRRV